MIGSFTAPLDFIPGISHLCIVFIFHFSSGLEECLRFYPEQVNAPKEDGYTSLHIAAANNYSDHVSLIASSVSPVTHISSVVLSELYNIIHMDVRC